MTQNDQAKCQLINFVIIKHLRRCELAHDQVDQVQNAAWVVIRAAFARAADAVRGGPYNLRVMTGNVSRVCGRAADLVRGIFAVPSRNTVDECCATRKRRTRRRASAKHPVQIFTQHGIGLAVISYRALSLRRVKCLRLARARVERACLCVIRSIALHLRVVR